MSRIRLSDLPIHTSGSVLHLELSDVKKMRLEDLGICRDAKITHIHTAPAGSPIAFVVKGAVIALRRDDCSKIMVEPDV